MKKLLLAAAFLSAAGSASALDVTGTANACSINQGTTNGFNWCRTVLTSATTASQLGRMNIVPTKRITMVFGVSGSAVANVVTPTVTLWLGNQAIATQNVSVSTVGNVVQFGSAQGVPFFNAISVSQSQPSLISQTNAIVYGLTENNSQTPQ